MKFKMVLPLVFLALISCAGLPPDRAVRYAVDHPEYGEVELSDSRYKASQADCENKIYIKDIDVKGELLRSRSDLQKAYNRYEGPIFLPISSAYGVDEAKRRYSKIDHPDYIDEIVSLGDSFNKCLEQEYNWSKKRTIMYSKSTGKILEEW